MPVQSQNIRKMKNSFVATNFKIHRNRRQVPHFHVAGVQKIIIEKRNVPHVKVSALYARERATGLKDAKQSTLWNLNRKARWAVSEPLKEKIKTLHLSYRYQWEAQSQMALRQLSLGAERTACGLGILEHIIGIYVHLALPDYITCS